MGKKMKQEKQRISAWRRAGGVKSDAGEAGRRARDLEEEQEEPKVKQEMRAKEQEIWKKSRSGWRGKKWSGKKRMSTERRAGGVKSEAGKAGRRE